VIIDTGGNNSVNGGDGDDTVTLSGATGSNIVDLGIGANLFSHTGGGADTVSAGVGSDSLLFTGQHSGNDVISLGSTTGNDTVTVSGADTAGAPLTGFVNITTGSGDDKITVTENGNDTVNSGAGNDSVSLTGTGNHTVSLGDGNDTLTSGAASTTQSDNIDAGAGNDIVFLTSGGNDTINGGDGNDTITHVGTGVDVLFGGNGSDQFNFGPSESNNLIGSQDQIKDWQGGSDTLHFMTAASTGPTTPGATAGAGTAGNFFATTATDYASATTIANNEFVAGMKYVAVQIGNDTVVFADNGGTAHALDASDDAVVLIGRSLADITFASIV